KSTDVPKQAVILAEAVLRTNVGGPEVMRRQLVTLANVSRPWRLRVLPFRAPAHPGLMGAFHVFEFPPKVRKPAVYVEGPRRNFYLDDEASVGRASADFATLWNTSLSEEESRELILSVTEEWKE